MRPLGRPTRGLPVVALGLDELEALRLADLEGLYHEEAARRMGISRATFGRILAAARRKVARALIEQCVLAVGEGPVVGPTGEPCCGAAGRPRRHRCPRHDETSEPGTRRVSRSEGGSSR